MKSIYLSEDTEIIKDVYNMNEKVFVKNDILSNPENFKDTEFIFSTWSMPTFTEEEIKEYLPSLKAVFYGAGTVQFFARPFLNLGIKVFSAWAANAVPVAEYTVAQIILANKGFFKTMRYVDREGSRETFNKFPGNYGGDTTGKAYVLHDGANIYLAIEVDNKYPLGEYTDALANFGTGYKETAAELYFDWKDDGASSMKWIAWADAKSQIFEKDDNAEKGLVKEYKATSDAAKKTYIMEYKIQLASGVKTGSNVGWCIMLNANTDPKNPKQEKIAIPTKLNNINVANKPAEWLSFTLDSTEIKVEAPKAPAASAATADPAILAVVSLAAASGAAFISKKRK